MKVMHQNKSLYKQDPPHLKKSSNKKEVPYPLPPASPEKVKKKAADVPIFDKEKRVQFSKPSPKPPLNNKSLQRTNRSSLSQE